MEFKRGARAVAAAMAIVLTGCGAPRPRNETSQPVNPSTVAPADDTAATAQPLQHWRIDPTQSEVRLLVYRAGAMARLGHNHVIVNRALRGWVAFATAGNPAALSLSLPVDAFVVDDTQARNEEGVDFAEEVQDDAKAGTRHNMLGAALLDAARFPDIALDSVSVTQTAGVWSATLTVHVAGHDSTVTAPFALNRLDHGWSAEGSVRVQQSSLGLTPFSVMLGALAVRDDLTVKFKLVAEAP